VNEQEKRILVVDDDAAIRVLLLTILERRGHAVDGAADGAEALDRLKRGTYTMMLLDLMMPRQSGWDVLGEVASWPRERRPIIIVLTAGPEPHLLDPKIVAGTVRKPFDVEVLTDLISACVRGPGQPPLDELAAADAVAPLLARNNIN
jgi:CheY-like chemotaxis protein